MTTKIISFFILPFIFSMLSFGQCDKKDGIFFFDADSVCIGIFYKSKDKIDSTAYWDLKQNKINVVFEVPEYKFGIDSLNNFILKEFRERLDFVEVNGAALVYILLKNHKIEEIRIGKRIGYHEKYNSLIKETLMLTNDNWIISDKMKEPILFVYLFKMK